MNNELMKQLGGEPVEMPLIAPEKGRAKEKAARKERRVERRRRK